MSIEAHVAELRETQRYFEKSTAALEEADSGFAPVDGMMTAAQQVAHAALTVEWFVEGAFRPEGFDLDFERHIQEAAAFDSLAAARERFSKAFAEAIEVIGSKSGDEMRARLPEGPVMGGLPRSAIVGGITDHTAHHRGALTVYARLCGHVPEMPY